MSKTAILCVANWDSDVGYAWWLMESFWIHIAKYYDKKHEVLLAYPSVSKIPIDIGASTLKIFEEDFTFVSPLNLPFQIYFILKNKVKYIYFSDRPNKSWRYVFYRLAGVKIIIAHDHTPGKRSTPKFFKKKFKIIINRIPFYTTNASIGATEFVKQRLIDVNCIPEYRCYTAPNGIPMQVQKNKLNLTTLFNFSKDRKVIVSVGRVSFYKGVDFALESIKILIQELKCKNVHFLYLGDGPDFESVKKMTLSLGISDYVTFAGRVDYIDKILCSCSVAFHPSKGEVGYSLSILECMRAGLPLVLSNNPSVCEAIDDGIDGLVYCQDDVYAAANALNKLLNDSELANEMGKAGANKVATKYSHDKCLASLINILDKFFK